MQKQFMLACKAKLVNVLLQRLNDLNPSQLRCNTLLVTVCLQKQDALLFMCKASPSTCKSSTALSSEPLLTALLRPDCHCAQTGHFPSWCAKSSSCTCKSCASSTSEPLSIAQLQPPCHCMPAQDKAPICQVCQSHSSAHAPAAF